MTRIPDDLKELGEPARAAHVFGRTGARTGHTAGIATAIGRNDLFELEGVLPVVTEVVAISHRVDPIRQEPHDRNLPPGSARTLVGHLVIRDADSCDPSGLRIRQDEFVQVIVFPAHRVLNCDVEIPKGVAMLACVDCRPMLEISQGLEVIPRIETATRQAPAPDTRFVVSPHAQPDS